MVKFADEVKTEPLKFKLSEQKNKIRKMVDRKTLLKLILAKQKLKAKLSRTVAKSSNDQNYSKKKKSLKKVAKS